MKTLVFLSFFSTLLFAGDKTKFNVCIGKTQAGAHYLEMTDQDEPEERDFLAVEKSSEKKEDTKAIYSHKIVEVDKNDVPVEQTVIKLEFDTKSLEGKLVFIEEEESKEASFKLKAHEKKEAKNLPKNAVIFSHCGEVEVELE